MDELDNADRARMLSIIDQFRAFGISKDTSLPQVRLNLSIASLVKLTMALAGRGR